MKIICMVKLIRNNSFQNIIYTYHPPLIEHLYIYAHLSKLPIMWQQRMHEIMQTELKNQNKKKLWLWP